MRLEAEKVMLELQENERNRILQQNVEKFGRKMAEIAARPRAYPLQWDAFMIMINDLRPVTTQSYSKFELFMNNDS
jgi:lauroyl/myristoyl acyltransferase